MSARTRVDPALAAEAKRLGVQTSYVSAAGETIDADPQSVALVVDALSASAAAPASFVSGYPSGARRIRRHGLGRLLDAVVVIGGPAQAPAPSVEWGRIGDASLALADGTVLTGDEIRAAWESLPHGCHTLDLVAVDGSEERSTVVVAPLSMPGIAPAARRVGVFTPTYGLWSAGDPLPAVHHLGDLAALLGQRGVDVLFTLPLYDLFLDEPYDPSPYSPVSRLHWNEVLLDDTSLPAAPLPSGIDGPLVEWRALARRRRAQLVDAAAALPATVVAQLDAFVAARGDVGEYARFRAGADRHGHPAALVERSYVLAQWLAHRQLATAAGRGATLGLDLPIGSHASGFETWAYPERFAIGCTVGAPPDPLALDGQDWGFPPQLPHASRASGHELWRRLVDRASEHAGVLRIDHVMAVHRLWWIPPGEPSSRGVYVRYPADEILAVIAATAARHGTVVAGENLGTVPVEVDEAMDRWKMLGLYEEAFHFSDPHLPTIPARSVAGIRTHDMVPFAALTASVSGYPSGGRRISGHERTLPSVEAVLTRLAESDAVLTVADLDDLIGSARPHNEPGRPSPATWRRRMELALPDVVAAPEVSRRLDLITARPAGEDPDE